MIDSSGRLVCHFRFLKLPEAFPPPTGRQGSGVSDDGQTAEIALRTQRESTPMNFSETHLGGAYIIEIEKREDQRGFFARAWCQKEFGGRSLVTHFVQSNVSLSKRAGTLRGMHYQAAPNQEVKLIRCTRGAIWDVIIDLRPGSPTYTKWIGVELTDNNYKMLYVPENFAHGFLTLEDSTEVTYLVSAFYSPESERGVRYNDPQFQMRWPMEIRAISDKDKSWPDYSQ